MQANNTKGNSKKKSGGFVFYPQQYVLDASNPDESFALGVTHGGHYCRVFINPPASARDKAKNSEIANDIPVMEAFAETHKKARKPCFCSPDNSSQNPNGILLIEQVEKIESADGIPTYQGKWASVLRENHEMPQTHVGRGYLEINFNTNQKGDALEYSHQYRDLQSRIENNQVHDHLEAKSELNRLYSAIIASRKKLFVGCIIKHQEIISISSADPIALKDALRTPLLRYTGSGMYGGALVRVRSGKYVSEKSCSQCEMSLDYSSNQIVDVETVLLDFLKYNFGKIKAAMASNGAVIEVIPVQRINCGPKGNSKYSKEMEQSSDAKILKTYVEGQSRANPLINFKREKKFLFANIAAKTAEVYSGQSTGNILLSVLHAFSAPKGNIFSIDSYGEATLKVVAPKADTAVTAGNQRAPMINGAPSHREMGQGEHLPNGAPLMEHYRQHSSEYAV